MSRLQGSSSASVGGAEDGRDPTTLKQLWAGVTRGEPGSPAGSGPSPLARALSRLPLSRLPCC